MPGYYNGFGYGTPSYLYGQTAGYNPMVPNGMTATQSPNAPQQGYSSASYMPRAMEWVEGEVGAKAYQMPTGWPANQPIPLWDTTDAVIWFKSWSPMGIPNPLSKVTYTMPKQVGHLPGMAIPGDGSYVNASSASEPEKYATKDDLESVKREIKEMIAGMSQNNIPVSERAFSDNQNGSRNQMNNGNRGGNR